MRSFFTYSWEEKDEMIQAIRNLPHTEAFLKKRKIEMAVDKYNNLPKWKKLFTKKPKS